MTYSISGPSRPCTQLPGCRPVWVIDKDEVEALEEAFDDILSSRRRHLADKPIHTRCFLSELPLEILLSISDFARPKDIGNLRATCRSIFNCISNGSRFYRAYADTSSYLINSERSLQDLLELAKHPKFGPLIRHVRLTSVIFVLSDDMNPQGPTSMAQTDFSDAEPSAHGSGADISKAQIESARLSMEQQNTQVYRTQCMDMLRLSMETFRSRGQNVFLTIEDFPADFTRRLRPMRCSLDDSAELFDFTRKSTNSAFSIVTNAMKLARWWPTNLQLIGMAGGAFMTSFDWSTSLADTTKAMYGHLTSLTISIVIDSDYRALERDPHGDKIEVASSAFRLVLGQAQNLRKLVLNHTNDSWHTVLPWAMERRTSRFQMLFLDIHLSKLSELVLGNISTELDFLEKFLLDHADTLDVVQLINVNAFPVGSLGVDYETRSNNAVWRTLDSVQSRLAPRKLNVSFFESDEDEDSYCIPVSRYQPEVSIKSVTRLGSE